jgi:hypothetical protein
MSEPFSWIKAFDFSFPAIGKSLSVCLKTGLIILVCWWLYVTLLKPHINPVPTTDQEAEEIVNNDNSPKVWFGCSAVKIYMKQAK